MGVLRTMHGIEWNPRHFSEFVNGFDFCSAHPPYDEQPPADSLTVELLIQNAVPRGNYPSYSGPTFSRYYAQPLAELVSLAAIESDQLLDLSLYSYCTYWRRADSPKRNCGKLVRQNKCWAAKNDKWTDGLLPSLPAMGILTWWLDAISWLKNWMNQWWLSPCQKSGASNWNCCCIQTQDPKMPPHALGKEIGSKAYFP